MRALVTSILRDRSGATAIEYGLIAALVAIAAMAGMGLLGTSLNSLFGFLGTTITGATP